MFCKREGGCFLVRILLYHLFAGCFVTLLSRSERFWSYGCFLFLHKSFVPLYSRHSFLVPFSRFFFSLLFFFFLPKDASPPSTFILLLFLFFHDTVYYLSLARRRLCESQGRHWGKELALLQPLCRVSCWAKTVSVVRGRKQEQYLLIYLLYGEVPSPQGIIEIE